MFCEVDRNLMFKEKIIIGIYELSNDALLSHRKLELIFIEVVNMFCQLFINLDIDVQFFKNVTFPNIPESKNE